jgi:uncharacterized repeat protein (TIGR01451 family)
MGDAGFRPPEVRMRFRILATTMILTLAVACSDQPTEVERDPTSAPSAGTVAFATATSGDGLSITTDKDDYAPGDTVWFTGAGWTSGDSVDIVLTDDPTHDYHTWSVGIGEDGSFKDSTYVVDVNDIGVTFTLTATSRRNTAQTLTVLFTDANMVVKSNLPGVTFQLTAQKFTSNNCTTGGQPTTTVTVDNSGTASSFSAVSGESFGFTAAITSVQSASFNNWVSSDPFTGSNPICAPGTNGGPRTYTANYSASSDLTVAKTAGTFAVGTPGGTYTISVGNAGSASALGSAGITVIDILPSGLTFVSGGGTNGWQACTASGQTVTCTLAPGQSIAPGVPRTFPITVNVALSACPSVTNSATVSGGGEPAGNTGNNGSGNVVTTISSGCPSLNSPPQVDAGGPYSGGEGSAIALNQATATDPNAGDDLLFTWSSSSTSCAFSAANVLQPTVTCTDNGSYTATLSVDDQHGHVVTSDATVNVSNVAPTATGLSTNSPVNEGSGIVFSLTGVSDISSVDATSLRYAFDCGDGSGYGAGTYAAASATNSATCSTNDDGTRTVKGKVFDKDGDASSEQSAVVTINNVPPSATGLATNSPVDEGSNIVFSLTGVSDVSTVDAAGLRYAFDCGSGSGFSASSYATAGATNSASCPTTDNGSRTVKGKVFDKDDGVSGEQSATVTIKNVAPSITSVSANPSGQLTLGQNNQVSTTVTVGFTDPATTYDEPFSTAIDCGNGTSTNGSPTTYGSSSGTCTYSAADVGFNNISAKVTDNDNGESAAGTTQVQVIFNWSGFFQPIDNSLFNVTRAGSAIPAKFNLGGNQGLSIFYVGDPKAYPNSSQVNCDSHADEDTIEETVNAGGSSLTYDAAASQYVYVWKTDKLWAGKCRRLDVKLIDGTTHSAVFKFKN